MPDNNCSSRLTIWIKIITTLVRPMPNLHIRVFTKTLTNLTLVLILSSTLKWVVFVMWILYYFIINVLLKSEKKSEFVLFDVKDTKYIAFCVISMWIENFVIHLCSFLWDVCTYLKICFFFLSILKVSKFTDYTILFAFEWMSINAYNNNQSN